MAYSRWLDSYFYTYWCVHPSGEQETRDNAIFEVCSVARFSAKQLRDDIEACVQEAVRNCEGYDWSPDERDVDDLRSCMKEFLRDIDSEYPATAEKSP